MKILSYCLLKQKICSCRELRDKMQFELQKEQEMLKKRHSESIANIQREFESEKQLKKEKCSMQISKFMSNGQNFDDMTENEEKREIEV